MWCGLIFWMRVPSYCSVDFQGVWLAGQWRSCISGRAETASDLNKKNSTLHRMSTPRWFPILFCFLTSLYAHSCKIIAPNLGIKLTQSASTPQCLSYSSWQTQQPFAVNFHCCEFQFALSCNRLNWQFCQRLGKHPPAPSPKPHWHLLTYVCADACMHTYTHTHIHAHTHSRLHTHMHAHTHKRAPTDAWLYKHTQIYACTHAHACTHICLHTHTHTCMHTCTHARTHARTCTHTHT